MKSKFVYNKNIEDQINKMKLDDGIRILPVLSKKTNKIVDIKRLDFSRKLFIEYSNFDYGWWQR